MRINTLPFIAILFIFLIACSESENSIDDQTPEPEEPSTPEFTLGIESSDVNIGDTITATIDLTNDVEILKAEIFFDEQAVETKLSPPFSFKLPTAYIELGSHKITCIVTSTNNLSKKEELNINATLQIGSQYAGGYVFYIDDSNEHGLVAMDENLKIGSDLLFQWGCNTHTLGASSFDDGLANTTTISHSCSLGAARLCYELDHNDYRDWYLPAKNEINMLYEVWTKIPGLWVGRGYWSSTESTFDSAHRAYYFYFEDGKWEEFTLKTSKQQVRPIRKF